jgi:carbamoyltransferase
LSIILGINAYHADSSACIVHDGKLIAAAEEERFTRIKHWGGFPSEAIKFCLREANVDLSQITHISINQDSQSNFLRKITFTLFNQPSLKLIFNRIKNKKKRKNILDELSRNIDKTFSGAFYEIEHHYAHLCSAFFVSPFDKAVVLSIDGFGDFASTAWGLGKNKNINLDNKIFFPHSLGIFYQALTQWLGFLNYGDEYKVMGLAPYGQPNFMNEMRDIVILQSNGNFKLNLKYFRHHKDQIDFKLNSGEPNIGILYSQKLIEILGPPRSKEDPITQKHKDLARSIQSMYEEAFFHLLNALYTKYKEDNLCLAGGCAMNSVANGKIYKNTPFKKVYIQSAAGDAGGAIGSAYAVWHKLGGHRSFEMIHSYWGPQYSNSDFENLLKKNYGELLKKGCSFSQVANESLLTHEIAKEISEGKVVGWFQGRMEWGPRALGNRSILGDPRRSDMKDILNIKIKRRESFRPFAPSITREAVNDWFEQDDDVPFMMQVYPVIKSKRPLIPAVTHIDGSGRLQTVTIESNPTYYNLIKAFEKISGIPILLNTSFNENEPIVSSPQEALNCFLRTKMDVLVLGNWILKRF